MSSRVDLYRPGLTGILGAVVLTTAVSVPVPALAQGAVLEEVVVTAQRREQSLQEVPISIETFGGEELARQGYRTMAELSAFSPSVVINSSSVQDQEVTIRGFGTIGNSLTLEQAVPMFVDGIHFGRQSMIKTAFIDTERVEVLKGPQPVFFGMNATAGAFNIESRKPTPEWEGYVNAEVGSNQSFEGSFGVGGPLTDTFGIRVAGIKEVSDGFLEHPVTGEMEPNYDHLGGRVTLQWNPTNNLQITTKMEGSRLRNGSDPVIGCLTGDSQIFPFQSPLDGARELDGNPAFPPDTASAVEITDEPAERAIWQDPPLGEGWDVPHEGLDRAPNCFESDLAIPNGGPYFEPPMNVAEENSTTGMIDIREASDVFTTTDGAGITGADNYGIEGQDYIDSWSAYLDVLYTFDNGVEMNWKSAYVDFVRNNVRDNSNSPFLLNFQGREEDFTQWSSELRFTSQPGGIDLGGVNLEWMAGLHYQTTTKDNFSNSLRATVRRGQRYNNLWEDVTWLSGFSTVTINFLDDRASLDLGGRVANIDKDVFIRGYGAAWIFDVEPCAPGPDDDLGGSFDDAPCGTQHTEARMVAPADNPRLLVDSADTTNLWTLGYNNSRSTPVNWRGGRAAAVGLTAPDFSEREGPHRDSFSVTEFDPQVTLRYRLGQNHSFFARWAQAFKASGYDTGQTSIPETIDDMKFGAEQGETYELGAKGQVLNGRARYSVTLFRTDFNDLQLSGLAPISDRDETSISLNAGKQRVEGIEFGGQYAATERLTLGLQGALMDGTMKSFAGSGCNEQELANAINDLGVAGLGNCDPDTELIDRSGDQAPRTPDWKFVASLDYTQPVLDDYRLSFNAKGYISDGYITDRDGFSRLIKFNQHEDLNLSLGIGDRDGAWEVIGFARNLLEPRQSYNRQFDVEGQRLGFVFAEAQASSFASYGVQFRYNFFTE